MTFESTSMLGSPNATHQRPECICSTAEHPTLATENVFSNFEWKKDHYKLCLRCHQTWATYSTPSVQPHVIRWQKRHPMEILEQFRQYCLEYAARRLFRQTEIMCVCSTPASEIIDTRTRSSFSWSDEYPKLCDDCARAWDIIIKARGHASRDVESSRKFIKKHPMRNVEEFIEFTMERRLDEDKPDPKAKSKAKSKANPEPKPDGPP